MSAVSGTKIVTAGLLLAIDAASPKCMVAGGTTCKNLITGGLLTGASGTPGSGTHTPNAANFPEHSSLFGGVFDFAGGRGMNVDEDLGSRTAISISMWLYKNDDGTQYFTDGRNNGGQWFLSNYTSDNINYTELLTYDFDGSYDADNPNFLNRWIHMVATSDSSGSVLYLNGNQVNTTNESSFDEDIGKNFRIGTRYTTSSEWTGYMGPIYIYDRKISAAEAKQNFLAQKGRFDNGDLLVYS